MNRLISSMLIFIISIILFTVAGISISLEQEPAKGSSEVPEHLHTDITDIRYLVLVVSACSLVCSAIMMYTDRGMEVN